MLNKAGRDWAEAGLDARSRRHLAVIVRQCLIMAAVCLPFALASDTPGTEFLLLLRTAFGFASFSLVIAAVLSGAAVSRFSLCIWDNAAALLLLKLACALALDGLA
jgi:fructose-1,6-bisphosphatase/inositol monophosphatase family enzyme